MVQQRPIRRPRGMALIMVLVVVGVTSVMAVSMLASSAMQAQVASVPAERSQRQYLAESGLNLALYYLQNPSKSPVELVWGTYGNRHYPGESGIRIPDVDGTLTINVTNTAHGAFSITATGTIDNLSSTARATISMTKERVFQKGAHLTGAVTLSSNTGITGGLITTGALSATAGQVSGGIVASNGPSYGGTTPPPGTEQSYPISITHYLPYYFHNGQRYRAARLPSLILGGTLVDLNFAGNPRNVWYADSHVTVMAGTSINGTIIMPDNRNLTLLSNLTITPHSTMPGLVAESDVVFNSNYRALTVNGLAYIAGKVRGSGSTSECDVNINGTLVAGSNGWPVNTSGFRGWMNIVYNESRATVSGFADEIEHVKSLNIHSWEIDNGRPQ